MKKSFESVEKLCLKNHYLFLIVDEYIIQKSISLIKFQYASRIICFLFTITFQIFFAAFGCQYIWLLKVKLQKTFIWKDLVFNS